MVCSASIACAIVIASLTHFVASESVYEVLGKRKHLSEFYSKVGLETVLVTLLDSRVVTVFAPTNEAFRKFRARKSDDYKSDDTALAPRIYVMNSLAEKHDFPLRKAPYKADVAPLYMTVKNETYQPIEYFVNNAKIIGQEECRGTRGEKQILYIIDDILEQYIPHMVVAPHALDLLKSPGIYKDIKEPLDAFASRVTSEREKEIFNRVGQHTFFIPVGSAEEEANSAKLREIDTWVVRGHVISGQVLFLRTMSRKSYQSQTWGDNLKVELKITNESPNEDYDQWYIQSNTIIGDARHRKGVVRAKIVRPNIPVSNGVIHLISKPLMIIDKTIWNHIEELKDTKLGEFYNLASRDANFMSHLKSSDQTTVFAPTDKAFKSLQNLDKFQDIVSDSMATRHMLELHMVMRPIVTEDVWNKSVISMSASDNRRNLYLRAIGDERNKTLTVEGEGVNATAIMGDLGATNGILHVIDGVLGMPYLTIYSKLAQDPDLHTTYKLGMQESWNQKLSDKEKRYTFFAPSREAWEDLQKEMPSEHKQLNLGLFSYHVQKILDRHLVVGHVFTKEDLESQKSVQMVHGNFQISSGYETGSLKVKWEGLEAHIVRPDVKATNGIIHVIDRVMMKRRDLTKSGAESSRPPIITLALAVILVLVQIAL